VKVFIIKRALFRVLYRIAMLCRSLISPFIPTKSRQQLKTRLLNLAYPLKLTKNNNELVMNDVQIGGINLIGYARAEMGIGESCRIAARSMSAAGIPFGIINYTGTNRARMTDYTWKHKEMKEPIHPINIFHINAEQMMEVYAQYSSNLFDNRYNIGYWHWELPNFPDEWQSSFKILDEIWVPSSFVANSVSMNSPVPVVRIPHGIEVNIINRRERAYFNLPERSFLFLTMYDVRSYQERKNPLASIAAFKSTFDSNDMSVGLVIKVNSAKSGFDELESLKANISDYKNIYLITNVLSRDDTNSLIQCVDSFISLHRSEGFGLGLAEAMYLGKPAIGTNWSSNIDFMNNQNSCLVNYEVIQVGSDYGPYKAHQYWADPDVEHAGSYMRRLVNNEDYYQEMSSRGEFTIKRDFSPTAAGSLMNKRMQYIKLNFGG
jgi:glycosyltransferase involved in cell wall biosynthesis